MFRLKFEILFHFMRYIVSWVCWYFKFEIFDFWLNFLSFYFMIFKMISLYLFVCLFCKSSLSCIAHCKKNKLSRTSALLYNIIPHTHTQTRPQKFAESSWHKFAVTKSTADWAALGVLPLRLIRPTRQHGWVLHFKLKYFPGGENCQGNVWLSSPS